MSRSYASTVPVNVFPVTPGSGKVQCAQGYVNSPAGDICWLQFFDRPTAPAEDDVPFMSIAMAPNDNFNVPLYDLEVSALWCGLSSSYFDYQAPGAQLMMITVLVRS